MVAATLGHGAMAQGYAVETRTDVPYVEHDGVKLTGNLYLPKGVDKAPILIAAHGGGWQGGNPDAFKLYGPYLAKNGYAVYAIRYRLAKPGAWRRDPWSFAVAATRSNIRDCSSSPIDPDKEAGSRTALAGTARPPPVPPPRSTRVRCQSLEYRHRRMREHRRRRQ